MYYSFYGLNPKPTDVTLYLKDTTERRMVRERGGVMRAFHQR